MAPSHELQAQAERIIQKSMIGFGKAIAHRDREIQNKHARLGTLRSGACIQARLAAREVAVRENCSTVLADLVALFLRYNALTAENGEWINQRLDRRVDEFVESLLKAAETLAEGDQPLAKSLKQEVEPLGLSIKAQAHLNVDMAVADAALAAKAPAPTDRPSPGPGTSLDPLDLKIVEALKAELPTASASYEQGARDVLEPGRSSYRGPVTDLREALRETLHHLAPDDEVMAQADFKAETDSGKPSHRQRARYVLKKKQASKRIIESTADAADQVETRLSNFVRSTYDRSSVSTHTLKSQVEATIVRDLVRAALASLLELV